MLCLACVDRKVDEGLLCDPCASRLRGKHPLCAEQITCLVEGSPERAGLLDEWGRIHPVAEVTPIGRQLVAGSICIAEPSVSRRHAEVRRSGDSWEVRDLGSSNGTTVNGRRVDGRALAHNDVITFGHVSFLFVSDVSAVQNRSFQAPTTVKPAAGGDDDEVIEETFSGLRRAGLSFFEPSGGGGGVLEIDGRSVQLTQIQLELFQVLARRMLDEEGRDERVRGFVRSSELLATLAWDTPKPEDNHMKQLVRRVRRALSRAGIPDIIESRHGFG